MGCSIAPLLRYASITRVSNPLNYSYIIPKQTEARKFSQKSEQIFHAKGPSVTQRMHITIQGFEILAVMGTTAWRAGLLVWFPPHRRKHVLVAEILNSDSRVPHFLCDTSHCFRLPRLCLPAHIMEQQHVLFSQGSQE